MATRRTTVIGLGGLLAGGGALLGTGAFTTVDAERSVALQTADDADAFLAFEVIDDAYVSDDGGVIEFELIADAKTTFDALVDVRNQGTQVVRSLRFEFSAATAEIENALQIVSGDTEIPATDDTNLLLASDEGDAENDELAPGDRIPFGIAVDLTGDEIDEIGDDAEIALTIIADTEEGGDAGPGEPSSGSDRFEFDDVSISGNPPRDLEFEIANTGSQLTITGFGVEFDPPGDGGGGGQGSVPDEFDSFTVDDPGGPSGDGGSVDETFDHEPYTIANGESATYSLDGFDANLNNNEFTLTLFAEQDGPFVVSQTLPN